MNTNSYVPYEPDERACEKLAAALLAQAIKDAAGTGPPT